MKTADIQGTRNPAIRILAALVLFFLMIGRLPAFAATTPWLTAPAATNVTSSGARIGATVKNPSRYRFTSCGFSLWRMENGQCVDRKTGSESISHTYSSFDVFYDTQKWYGALRGSATYGYQINAKYSGGTLTAGGSFTTPASLSVSLKPVVNLTNSGARVQATISNPNRNRITSCGFAIWETKNPGGKVEKSEFPNTTLATVDLWYDTQKWYKALTPDTGYSYRLWAAVGAERIYTPVASFTTPKQSPATVLRAPMDCTIFASTYGSGHNEANYAAVDMYNSTSWANCAATKGQPVHPVAAGKVWHLKSGDGQVVLIHETPLVTANNVTYATWYSTYGHMTSAGRLSIGDPVSPSSVIGYANSVGPNVQPGAYHLHFQINNCDPWYTKAEASCVSPYYLKFDKSIYYDTGKYMSLKIYDNPPK